jgi:Rps23 Pro-64 3,4-dihydroxylase Tpa1-like proline 4-hydroxylase
MLICDYNQYFKYVDGMFDDPIVFESLLKIKKKPISHTSHDKWDSELTNNNHSKKVKIWNDNLFSNFLKSYICIVIAEKFPELRSDNFKIVMQVCEWQEGSYITAHRDDHKLFAMTCYLDEEYDGGYFCYKENSESTIGTFLMPIKNRCVLIRKLFHEVTPVIKGQRTTLQIWGEENAVL